MARPWAVLPSVPVFQDHNLGPLFLTTTAAQRPWLLPEFKARALYSCRLAASALLACAWIFNAEAAVLFTPGILIPVACVRSGVCRAARARAGGRRGCLYCHPMFAVRMFGGMSPRRRSLLACEGRQRELRCVVACSPKNGCA